MTARADRDTLALGDTLRVWAALRNAGPRAVGVQYTSTCRFALRARARHGGGGTLTPGRSCRLDLIAGPLAPGARLADTLRWDGRWGDQPAPGGPAAAPVPAGEYEVWVVFTVDACGSGFDAPRPGCAREVASAPLRVTVAPRAPAR